MQTAWAALAQSMPTENLIASPPGTARHCAGRGPAGRSLIGALAWLGTWRVILWPGLSSFDSGERVSCGPSRGERPWLSPNGDRLAPLSSPHPTRAADFPSRGRVGQ